MLRRYVVETQAGELPWQKCWGPFWSRSGALRDFRLVAAQARLLLRLGPPEHPFQFRLRDRKTEVVEPLDIYREGPS